MQILIKVSEQEREGFRRAANIAGIGVFAWARQKLRSAAVQELQTIGEKAPLYRLWLWSIKRID